MTRSTRYWKSLTTKSWHRLPDGKVPSWLLHIAQATELLTQSRYRERMGLNGRKEKRKLNFGGSEQAEILYDKAKWMATTAHCLVAVTL